MSPSGVLRDPSHWMASQRALAEAQAQQAIDDLCDQKYVNIVADPALSCRVLEKSLRKVLISFIASSLAITTIAVVGAAGVLPASSSPPAQGVTATTIKVGIPYVDLAAVRQFGVTLDQGDFADAYNALIANLNAHGGINGRRVVPVHRCREPGWNRAVGNCLYPAGPGRRGPGGHRPPATRLLCPAVRHSDDRWKLSKCPSHQRRAEFQCPASRGRLRPAPTVRPGPPRFVQREDRRTVCRISDRRKRIAHRPEGTEVSRSVTFVKAPWTLHRLVMRQRRIRMSASLPRSFSQQGSMT